MAEDEEAIEESNEDSTAEEVKKRNKKKLQTKKSTEKSYKSSKDYYRAMAKQWGITCKMSDNCRCLDCQVIMIIIHLYCAWYSNETSGEFT